MTAPPADSPSAPSVLADTAAADAAARAQAYRRHWHTNLISIAVLLAISAAVSFVPPIWARQLAHWRIAGMELPFYMGAQGAIVLYVLLVAGYAIIMRRADDRLRTALAALPADDARDDDDSGIADRHARATTPGSGSTR